MIWLRYLSEDFHMGMRTKAYCVATSVLLLLVGCNIFNPSGNGDTNTSPSNLAEGDLLYERSDFAGAMDAYQRAILEDSANSLAYYGYAKATVRFYDISSASIISDIDSTTNEDSAEKANGVVFFLQHDTTTLTQRLDASIKVNYVLGILDKRDSLTRFYNYLRDTSSKDLAHQDSLNDTAYVKHLAFIKAYLAKADADSAGYYQRSQFPLSDLAMPMSTILADFGIYTVLYSITQTYDLGGDGVITGADVAFMSKLKITSGGSGSGSSGGGISGLDSVKGILGQTDTNKAAQAADSATRVGLNNVIQNLSSNLSTAGSIISQFLPTTTSSSSSSSSGSSDSGSTNTSTTTNVDSVISSLGGAITFYQFGDGKDNDGDGCIDEEILDGQDNDGDGFVDEDARVALPGDTVNYFDLHDNDHNGKTDAADFNSSLGYNNEALGPNKILGWINAWQKQPGYADSVYIKIQKSSANMNIRLQLQADSLSLPSNDSILAGTKAASAALKARLLGELDSAKNLIGGCWRNYP